MFEMDVSGNETLDETNEQAYCNTVPEKPYTWTQMAERTVWKHFFLVLIFHIGLVAALAFYTFRPYSVPMKWWTILWAFAVGVGTTFSITIGAHRLWSHRAFKAKLPLRIFLMTLFATAGLNPLYHFIRDHRQHHKYSETDADPHNTNRGFVFSHVAWLFMRRHPECRRRSKEISMSDIETDSVVMFQEKYAFSLKLVFCYILPTVIPIVLWDETILHAVLTQCFIRHMLILHITLSSNSILHRWGTRRFNRSINPVDNKFVDLLTLGEGSHNYHHTFPWDYKGARLQRPHFNAATLFIEAMAAIGLAYDLREPSPEFVEKVIRNVGYKSGITEVH